MIVENTCFQYPNKYISNSSHPSLSLGLFTENDTPEFVLDVPPDPKEQFNHYNMAIHEGHMMREQIQVILKRVKRLEEQVVDLNIQNLSLRQNQQQILDIHEAHQEILSTQVHLQDNPLFVKQVQEQILSIQNHTQQQWRKIQTILDEICQLFLKQTEEEHKKHQSIQDKLNDLFASQSSINEQIDTPIITPLTSSPQSPRKLDLIKNTRQRVLIDNFSSKVKLCMDMAKKKSPKEPSTKKTIQVDGNLQVLFKDLEKNNQSARATKIIDYSSIDTTKTSINKKSTTHRVLSSVFSKQIGFQLQTEIPRRKKSQPKSLDVSKQLIANNKNSYSVKKESPLNFESITEKSMKSMESAGLNFSSQIYNPKKMSIPIFLQSFRDDRRKP